MHKQTRTVVLLSLLCLLALSPLLVGCGGGNTAKPTASQAAEELSQEPTEEAVEEPTEASISEPTEAAATELENTFDNLLSLAPMHITSSLTYKSGDQVETNMSYEADVDANGNQHMTIVSNDQPVEIYLVDGKMYMGAEGDQYIGVGDVEDDAGFGFLAIYGGAYLLAFNDLQDATLVGREAVGPWQADKYEIKMDLGSLGLGGLVAGVEGAQWDYSGTAWVEPNAKALVKAVVDWSGKGSDETQTTSWHSEFLASEGTVTEITAPENVLGIGG